MIDKVKVLKDNEVYRVFDLIQRSYTDDLVTALRNDSRYDNTIMRKYFEKLKSTTGDRDIPTLLEIINEYADRCKVPTYGEDYVLVHIRTGDEIIRRGLLNPTNVDFYLNEISKHPNKKIRIVTAMHYGHKNEGSKLYRSTKNSYSDSSYLKNKELLEEFISKIPNEDVDIISNDDVDVDLCILALCENLIATSNAGGFAQIVLELNTANKNVNI